MDRPITQNEPDVAGRVRETAAIHAGDVGRSTHESMRAARASNDRVQAHGVAESAVSARCKGRAIGGCDGVMRCTCGEE